MQTSYDKQYDIIRDNFAAHQQELSLLNLINWWNEIDFATITVFHDDACKIKSEFLRSIGNFFQDINDYSPIDFSSSQLDGNSCKYYLSSDRLALAKENTVGMIACHKSQEKAQIILSIVELTLNNFKLTSIVNNPRTNYHQGLFNILWFLIICDTCSLFENLYGDTKENGIGLLQQWKKEGIKGYKILENCKQYRDHAFEIQLKKVRNKLCAHIDKNLTMSEIIDLYNNVDLARVHEYFLTNANIFKAACLKDIRTKPLIILNAKLNGVIGLESSSHKKFKD